jgi:hypothetical protein
MHLYGPPAAFAGNQFIAAVDGPYQGVLLLIDQQLGLGLRLYPLERNPRQPGRQVLHVHRQRVNSRQRYDIDVFERALKGLALFELGALAVGVNPDVPTDRRHQHVNMPVVIPPALDLVAMNADDRSLTAHLVLRSSGVPP